MYNKHIRQRLNIHKTKRAPININVKKVKTIRIVKPQRKKYKWPIYIKS